MSNMSIEKAAELRKPFPKSSIGKLPKGGVMLDYVGHAATTDRLLAVDPNWTWEPMALDERGLPALDGSRNLWIKLTICGVTRIGVGDGKSAKECIGDAIRNAAMRFGVALDLWSKEELEGFKADGIAPPTEDATVTPIRAPQQGGPKAVSQPQVKMIGALMGKAGLTQRDDALKYVADVIGREVESRNDLTAAEASKVIDALQQELGEVEP